MKIMSVDTSSSHVVVGYMEFNGTQCIVQDEHHSSQAGMHAEQCLSIIQKCGEKNNIHIRELDAIVVGLGPGPYTGMRVGIVAGMTIRDTLQIPAWGICTLDGFIPDVAMRHYVAMLDAKRKEVYWALYSCEGSTNTRIEGPFVSTQEEMEVDVSNITTEYVVATKLSGCMLIQKAYDAYVAGEQPDEITSLVEHGERGTGLLPEKTLFSISPLYIRKPSVLFSAVHDNIQRSD